MTARTWTPYKRAPIRTRVLLQFADGHQIIGRYDPEARLWLDDSHEDIIATNPDRELKYYRSLPNSKVEPKVLGKKVLATLGADEGEVVPSLIRAAGGTFFVTFAGEAERPIRANEIVDWSDRARNYVVRPRRPGEPAPF